MGFDGTVLGRRTERDALPDAAETLRLIDENLPGLIAELPSEQQTDWCRHSDAADTGRLGT